MWEIWHYSFVIVSLNLSNFESQCLLDAGIVHCSMDTGGLYICIYVCIYICIYMCMYNEGLAKAEPHWLKAMETHHTYKREDTDFAYIHKSTMGNKDWCRRFLRNNENRKSVCLGKVNDRGEPYVWCRRQKSAIGGRSATGQHRFSIASSCNGRWWEWCRVSCVGYYI